MTNFFFASLGSLFSILSMANAKKEAHGFILVLLKMAHRVNSLKSKLQSTLPNPERIILSNEILQRGYDIFTNNFGFDLFDIRNTVT